MAQRSVSFGTKKLTLIGDELKVGDKAPNFKALTKDLEEYEFFKDACGINILSVVPSLDTSTCELQTYILNKSIQENKENFNIISISNDLPFAQQRFVKEKESDKITFLTDYLHNDFSKSYGVLIEEFNLLNRAIFVVDQDNIIKHVEYVMQNTDLPDVDKAIEIAKSL